MPLKNIVVLAICGIVSLTCYSAAAKNRFANLFAEVVELVNREHLDAPDSQMLFDSAISGMMDILDDHSVYLAGNVFRMFDENIEQVFGGVGMYVDEDETSGFLMVTAPMPDTPAFEAGLHSRDLITAIDGETTMGKPRRVCIELMRGPVDTTVQLDIRRADKDFPVELKRRMIPVTSVFGDTTNPDGTKNFFLEEYPRIGYLRIDQFGERTTGETSAALRSIHGQVDSVILDLRNNGGGPLHSAIEVSDMFLESGLMIVETRGRDRKLLETHVSSAGMEIPSDIPVVILVNRYTASASEIVSACLQDHRRAVVIGEKTYGKGTVQNVFVLERNRSAVKLTVASYWPPGGRCIDKNDPVAKATRVWGVIPDPGFELELTEEEIVANYIDRQTLEIAGMVGAVVAAELLDAVSDMEKTPDLLEIPDAPGNAQTGLPSNPSTAQDTPQLQVVDKPLLRAIEWLRSRKMKNGEDRKPVIATKL